MKEGECDSFECMHQPVGQTSFLLYKYSKQVFYYANIAVYSGIPLLRTSKGNKNWFEKSESSRNFGVKLQHLTEEGKLLLVRVIRRFVRLRVREIGIPLYLYCNLDGIRYSWITTASTVVSVHNSVTQNIRLDHMQCCNNIKESYYFEEKNTKHKPELLKIEIEPSDEPQANIKP